MGHPQQRLYQHLQWLSLLMGHPQHRLYQHLQWLSLLMSHPQHRLYQHLQWLSLLKGHPSHSLTYVMMMKKKTLKSTHILMVIVHIIWIERHFCEQFIIMISSYIGLLQWFRIILKMNLIILMIINHHAGRGDALVESMTFNRRVVGSTPALAAI